MRAHALATLVVMTATTRTIHALTDPIRLNCRPDTKHSYRGCLDTNAAQHKVWMRDHDFIQYTTSHFIIGI